MLNDEEALSGAERRLLDYLKKNYEIFLLVGIGGAGKTELLGAYRQDGYLNRFKRQDGRMLPTAPVEFDTHPVSVDGRDVMFVDASGEDFRLLYRDEREDKKLDDKTQQIRFLRHVAQGLRGLVLLLDLKLLWHEKLKKIQSANQRQVEILCWVVELLRWLRYDGKYDEQSSVSFEEQVTRSVRRMRKRLDIPVQVIFSKADELVGLQLPKETFSADWIRREPSPERRIFPIGEDPLLFAYHCLSDLFRAVNNHADYFRFDFAHSLVLDQGSGTVADPHSCGVTLSLQWLLDPIWRRRRLMPTRTWIAAQRFFDERILRNRRWQRLLDPVEVRE